MPADLLLFALIAAGLVFWLRSILGTRDEDEKDYSGNIFDDKDEGFMGSIKKSIEKEDNVVSLKQGGRVNYNLPHYVRVDNKTTENALEDYIRDNPDFDIEHFVQGAEGAFSMIIEAFADGDLETLEGLLAPEVYRAFEGAVKARLDRGETVSTEIKNVEKIDITDLKVKDNHLFITVRFAAREVCIIRDKEDKIISGDPDKTTIMVDVWVFGRALDADGPEWYLFETRDDEIEDHKTPIPEGGSDKGEQ